MPKSVMPIIVILLQFGILLLTGCQTVSVAPIRDSSSVGITVHGAGIDKEKALQDAFRNAVEIISGTYIYSETKVSNFQLIKDEIATHTSGFIKGYEIIYEQKTDSLITLSVKCVVSKEPLKSIIRKLDLKTWDESIGNLATIQQTQARLKQSVELLKTFIGADADEYFKKAYQADIVGYSIESVGLNHVNGNYLVQVSLNTAFWEQYLSILKEVGISGNSNTLIETITEGLFNEACPETIVPKYYIPSDLQKYLLPRVSIYYWRPYQESLHKLQLNRNSITYLGTFRISNEELLKKVTSGYIVITPDSLFYNLKKPLFIEPYCGDGSTFFVPFKDSVIIRIPFSVKDETEIKRTLLSKKIPWVIFPGEGKRSTNAIKKILGISYVNDGRAEVE